MPVHNDDIEKKQGSQAVDTEILTLGMGCFWGPEALFGHLPGVLHTRTGYAGGTTPAPVYRQLGDHSETVEIEFNPAVITLEQLLELFWNHHNPSVINGYKGRQYQSLLFYRNEQQHRKMKQMQQMKRRTATTDEFSLQKARSYTADSAEAGNAETIDPAVLERRKLTEVQPYQAWYLAEARHQKYYLQRPHQLMERLYELYPDQTDLFHSTLAARLNGFSRGHITLAQIRQEIPDWLISKTMQQRIDQWLTDQQNER